MTQILALISELGGIPPLLPVLSKLSSQYEIKVLAHSQNILESVNLKLGSLVEYQVVNKSKKDLESILDAEKPQVIVTDSVPSIGNKRTDFFNYYQILFSAFFSVYISVFLPTTPALA